MAAEALALKTQLFDLQAAADRRVLEMQALLVRAWLPRACACQRLTPALLTPLLCAGS